MSKSGCWITRDKVLFGKQGVYFCTPHSDIFYCRFGVMSYWRYFHSFPRMGLWAKRRVPAGGEFIGRVKICSAIKLRFEKKLTASQIHYLNLKKNESVMFSIFHKNVNGNCWTRSFFVWVSLPYFSSLSLHCHTIGKKPKVSLMC